VRDVDEHAVSTALCTARIHRAVAGESIRENLFADSKLWKIPEVVVSEHVTRRRGLIDLG
jgi:hypothetical protein